MPPPPPPTTAQTRLLDMLLERVRQWVATTPLVSRTTKATVTAVTSGVATVSWQGTDVAAPHLASYTPAVNDVVAVVKTGSQLLIIGRIVGTP